ncbi:MAG: DUF4824 family protein [Gammaproteobacteria bacterium]
MRKYLLAAAIVLLLANVIVLAGVAYNRSGAPLESIELTERELPVKRSFGVTRENTATALSIKWNIPGQNEDPTRMFSTRGLPSWLTEEKLEELGVDVEELERNRDTSQPGIIPMLIEAILVLEYEGGAYRHALGLAESWEVELQKEASSNPEDAALANRQKIFSRRLASLKHSQSRLYIIDAGLDILALRQKYAGKGNYLFMRGELGLWWSENAFDGRIWRLSIGEIHVPLPFSHVLSDLAGERGNYPHQTPTTQPRYTVRLSIGKRLEPWIESVALMENGNND